MLRKITIENFFSIKDAQALDLEVARNATDPDGRFAKPIARSDKRFPKVVAIFGANASGKTNVLCALRFIQWFVETSVDRRIDESLSFLSFLDKESQNRVTKLFIEFDADLSSTAKLFPYRGPLVYQYSVEIATDRIHVNRETLRYFPQGRPRGLFDREGDAIKAGSDFKLRKNDPVREKIRPNASVISTLAKFNHRFSDAIVQEFQKIQTNVILHGKRELKKGDATSVYLNNREILENFLSEVQKMDFGIDKVSLVASGNGVEPMFHHVGLVGSLSYFFQSQGTQQFYNIFPYIFKVLQIGGTAVLDELDNDIHPLVLPELVRRFQDPETNPHNAQLIMSCHNATLLEYLTKEEIYFTEKDRSGRTQIYGLQDIKGVRRDANIYAKYLGGVFGAVPRVA